LTEEDANLPWEKVHSPGLGLNAPERLILILALISLMTIAVSLAGLALNTKQIVEEGMPLQFEGPVVIVMKDAETDQVVGIRVLGAKANGLRAINKEKRAH
jgi:hypothetical protein